jgi:hypothetical protein
MISALTPGRIVLGLIGVRLNISAQSYRMDWRMPVHKED